jgi:hypothetical protein
MAQRKRWGKKRKDKRDWRKYNEELVVRGEFYLNCDWVKTWNREIAEMNEGKVGAQYIYPDSMMRFLAVLGQWIDYRGLEGVSRKLVESSQLPQASDYSNICRRVNKMDVCFELPFDNCCVSTDGSGMKFENAGEYRARMYGKREKYLRVVISADPNRKKMLDCDVGIEGELDSEPDIAREHMEKLMLQGIDIKKFFGDGAHDDLDLWAFLEHNEIDPAVKPRKSAVLAGDGSLRDREVLKIKKGYKAWAREREYGIRWLGTEGIFSAVKRKFGEQTRSLRIENACNEVKRKFWVYDTMKAYAEKRT